jgi:WD40 repeat protein
MAGEGNILASCGKDKSIKIWDLNSNKLAMNISTQKFADLNYISVSNGVLNY